MLFPLGLYSIEVISYALELCLSTEHSLKSQVLFPILRMLYLEATTERGCLKYVFFKPRPNTVNKDTNTLQ